jgi:hypothetical protein
VAPEVLLLKGRLAHGNVTSWHCPVALPQSTPLSLSRSDYYNLHREKALKGVQDEFEALVHNLDEAGFKFAYRIELKRNQASEVVGHQLQQI